MKKKVLIIGLSLTIVVIIVGLLWFYLSTKTFYLEDKYYGASKSQELELKDIEDLIVKKESFVVFVYQPLCTTSANFSEIVKSFSKENGLTYYTIAFSEIKDSKTFEYIKYYPSFIIFKDGKMVDFLDAESNEDTEKYKKSSEFSKWFKTYVKLRDKDYTYIEEENTVSNETEPTEYNIKLNGVKREDNKVNIYFFWGDGCPHCKEEKAFFEDLKTKYGSKYNLYLYEVWYNAENKEILKAFASALGKKAGGVPFTIIGNQSFEGFNEEIGKEMIDAITSQHKNSYDVYFDTILNSNKK